MVIGKEALHPIDHFPVFGSRQRTIDRALTQLVGGLLALCLCLGFNQGSSHALGADVDLPIIEPLHRIYVEADTVAKAVRGGYDVMAFEGHCRLRQGELSGSASKLTLWIERRSQTDSNIPGKIVCLMEGNVEIDWGNQKRLRDQRWMGRLFSLHPIDTSKVQQQISRHDIPSLDWNRGAVQLAQYQSTGDGSSAPPLLFPNSGLSPSNTGALPAPMTTTNPSPSSSSRNSISATPGAVQWNANAGTSNSNLLPSTGLVIPDDGSQPYPAAGLPPSSGQTAPAFPAPGQVAYQVSPQSDFGVKSITFLPKGGRELTFSFSPDPATGESVGMIRGGFKMIVQGVQQLQADGTRTDYGTVTLEADNAVLWVRGDIGGLSGLTSTPDRPIEIYLDGNIVFQQGQRVIYADRMYYNVANEYGMVLQAEMITPVPQYVGLVRLKADVLQQRDRQHYLAHGAAMTSSRLGVPRYWLQSDEITFSDERKESDMSVFAPSDVSNRPTNMRATARNNFVYLSQIPIAYWPIFSTNLAKPSFYLTSLKYKSDRIFGQQIYSEFDAYQLLGINGPQGTSLTLSADYLSKRGPAGGFFFEYNRPTILFGIPGQGFSDAWIIQDDGLDLLGSDRDSLTPEKELRGRAYSRNRFFINPNLEAFLETGWVSDRNFLEQYFERQWDQEKDLSTSARLRRYNGNRMLDVWGQFRPNEFFTDSEWLPRLDHYWLGQDIGERLTYSEHSSIGYGHVRTATTPTAPADAAKFALLPWETDSEGLRAATRHELELPVSLGPWKFVPFISGEAAYWGEDVNQNSLTRFTGQAGLRGALPFWRAYPNIDNRLLDIRGIAHKVTLESELFYADSTQDLDRLPLYDPLDDNSQEHFRRRLIFNTFGGNLPAQFDERSFALRSGMQRWVTASSTEVVDDLTQLRMGVNQRWQTKRGLPGKERIVDWISLDVDWIYFPKPNRDNFGEDLGAVNYDFRYHVGDRLTLLSDGYFDFFDSGLKTISAGARISRPGRGDVYLGVLSLNGPISSNVLNGYANYRLNEKWILNGGAVFDLTHIGNIGQTISLTRVGETALVRFGLNADYGRDNVTFNINIEPRFLPLSRLGVVGGELIQPAGLYGLE